MFFIRITYQSTGVVKYLVAGLRATCSKHGYAKKLQLLIRAQIGYYLALLWLNWKANFDQ